MPAPPDRMQIKLNGTPIPTNAATIAALLDELELSDHPVLVEHNGTALFPRQFKETKLQADDQIEIVQLAAGG